MQFERLRKSHKKQIIIGAIAVCIIGGALTFNLTRAKYEITNDLELAKGTINYRVPDFRVVALYIESDNDYIETSDIPTDGYTLNTEKSACKIYDGTTNIESAPKDNNVIIEYKDGKVNFLNISKKNTRCYLYFAKKIGKTIEEIITTLNVKTEQPDFSQAATTDEGIYAMGDGMYGGTSYYWRGAATTNYLKFANKCWRIIRINGDKTIRLIYDGTSCHNNGTSTTDSIITLSTNKKSYSTNKSGNILEGNSEYVGYTWEQGKQRPINSINETDSNAKTQVETWYQNNIGNNTKYKQHIANGKFCNDRNIMTGYNWASMPTSSFNYSGFDRAGLNSSNVNPTLMCSDEDIYNLNVGIITIDEAIIAGAKYGVNTNIGHYLFNGQSYWTMTPSKWYYGNSTTKHAYMLQITGYGSYNETSVSNIYTGGFRPVINLNKDVSLTGNGTLNNPYVVVQ